MSRTYCVYIMSSKSGVLYIGSTSDLSGRVWDHKHGVNPGFTKRYRVTRLVYVEEFESAASGACAPIGKSLAMRVRPPPRALVSTAVINPHFRVVRSSEAAP
jgi:GIY-YIG catalytic domain